MAYTARRCPICPKEFTPTRKAQRACGFVCARKLAGRTWGAKGQPPAFAAALAQRKTARRRAVEQLCSRRWPELSVREIEIFNFAMQHGYARGYQKGYAHRKRQARQSVAA